MLSRLALLPAAALLVWAGSLLLRDEVALIGPRHIARHAIAVPTSIRNEEVETALSAFKRATFTREDVLLPLLDMALLLEARNPPATDEQRSLRFQEIETIARVISRHSPLNARSWCTLAIVSVRLRGFESQTEGLLQTCFDLAPREISVVEGRLMLALAVWDRLSQALRNRALVDIANGLGDDHYRGWMAERLAFAVAYVAPNRGDVAEEMISNYNEKVWPTYQQSLTRFLIERAKQRP